MTIRMWGTALAIAALAPAMGQAKEPLSVRVSPLQSFAPANLSIRATVEPDFNNRAMEVVADSEQFYRSSMIPLEGDRAPRVTLVKFLSLPSGDYDVTAVLIGADGHRRALAHAHVHVIESGL